MKVRLLKRVTVPRADRPGRSRIAEPPEELDLEPAVAERLVRLGVAEPVAAKRRAAS